MKSTMFAMLAAVSTAFAVASPLDKINESRLFDIDYRKLDNSPKPVDAQFAKGSPQGRVLHEARPRFDVEAMEAICHGIMVGEGCASIRYKTEGNLNPKTGSIEILFENTQWDWDNKDTHMLLQCVGPEMTIYIYKSGLNGCGAYIGGKNPKWGVFPRETIKKLSGRGKNHLLVTYSPEAVECYFNGKLVRSLKPEGEIGNWNKSFEIGPSGVFGRQGRTTISTVTTYDRVLTENEVHFLAKSRIPTLNFDDMKAETRTMIPAGTFLHDPGHLGIEALGDDYVVSPWTPIQRDGSKFSVWNRTYDFSGNDLVAGIIGGGDQLLDAPVNFIATADGKSEKVAWSSDLEMTIDGVGRKAFRRNIVSPSWLGGSVLTTIDYDGAVCFNLDLTGIDRAERFELDVPMSREYSDAIHYIGTNGMSLRSICCPDISYTKTLDNQPGVVYQGGLLTHAWVGTDKGGIQFYQDSDQGFYPKDRKDYFEVVRDEAGKSVLKVNFATAKTPAPEGKLAFRFGLIATPVRPMPERWREWSLSAQYDSFTGDERGTHLIYWPDYWGRQLTLDPDPVRATQKERNLARIKQDHAEHRKVIPYWSHRHVGVSSDTKFNPDYQYIKDNWGPIPQRSLSGGKDYVRVYSATGFADYLARCIAEYSKHLGQLDGFYMDEMEAIANCRKETNGGYDDYDGTRRLTFSVFSDRDMYKRLDAVVRAQNGGEMPSHVAHSSAAHMMEVMSHFPIFLTGEHLYSGYFPDSKEWIPPESDRLYYYSYSLPMDRVKREFYHGPWGAVISFMPCMKNQRDIMTRPEPTRDLLSRIMHADVIYWPLWCNKDEIYTVERFRREYGIGDPAVTYTPYWHNTLITSPQSDVCISYYDKKGDKLVIVSNVARKAQEVEVKLPAGAKEVFNAETHEKLPIANGTVKLNMKRNDYCALRVK